MSLPDSITDSTDTDTDTQRLTVYTAGADRSREATATGAKLPSGVITVEEVGPDEATTLAPDVEVFLNEAEMREYFLGNPETDDVWIENHDA